MQSLAGNRIPGYLERARDPDIVLDDLFELSKVEKCQFVRLKMKNCDRTESADEPVRTRCRRGRRGLIATGRSLIPSLPSRWRCDRPAASAWVMGQRAARPGVGSWRDPASMCECRGRGEPRLQRPPGVTRSHPRRCADAWGVGEGMCDGVGATRCCCGEDGGCCVIVNTCFYDNGRSLCRWIDFQNTEVD